jgi:hypothetical protein
VLRQSPGPSRHARCYKPKALRYLTGDGTAYLSRLRWSDWNRPAARATGLWHTDNCIPDCADGAWSFRRITVHAYRVRRCHRSGALVYTRLRIPGSNIGGSGRVLNLAHDCH